MNPRMEKNTTVDFLRGISALWVVLAHCCLWGGYSGYAPDPKVAVDIFMMVSGYLMMFTVGLTHVTEPLDHHRNWLRFYIRRFFRISPGYYASLVAAALLAGLYITSYQTLGKLNHNNYLASLTADLGPRNLFYHFTYLFGVMPKRAFSTLLPDWSLGLEVQFYIAFPLLFIIFKKAMTNLRLFGYCVLIIGLSAITRKTILHGFGEPSLLFYQLPFFMIGILIFYASSMKSKASKVFPLILVLLFCIYGMILKNHQDNAYLILAAALLVLSTSGHRYGVWINQFFDNKLTESMANLSFSLYLFHGFILSILGATIESRLYRLGYSPGLCVSLMIITVVPLAYLTAFASYRFIELPGIRMGKWLLKRIAVD